MPIHIPVLLRQCLELLDPKPGEVVVDCTSGLGGHAVAMGERVKPDGRVLGFDLDPNNLKIAAARAGESGVNFEPVHTSFVRTPAELQLRRLRADIVLADLGFSSNQMDDPHRGLSFQSDAPLDMRLDPGGPITAADVLAAINEPDLANMIYEYGEDPLARKIARKIVQNRAHEPIATTARLARLVQEAYGPRARSSRMHPATRTFMALRIAVNDELGALRSLLDSISRAAENLKDCPWLNDGARVAIISFHSLEDRMVKHAFADLVNRNLATLLTKSRKPVGPDDDEVQVNPRSRSAKLRAIKVGGAAGDS
jgi:16S rRNA (cytosine1402-N4)-methyltransferase